MSSERDDLDTVKLPREFRDAFDRLTDADVQPATLAEALAGFDRRLSADGVTITVGDMYRSEPTRHAVRFDEKVEHVPCVLDALVAAFVVDHDPVEIRSESPESGQTIGITVVDDEVSVSPASAVFSIGIADEAESVSSLQDSSAVEFATCQYINAFADETEFEDWVDERSSAAVIGFDTEQMVALARRAAGSLVTPTGS